MVRIPPNKVQEELDEQEDINYGTGYTEGDPDKFKSTKDMVEDVTGNPPDPEQDGFTMDEEVKKDEEAIEDGAGTPGYPGKDEELSEE